MDEGEIVLTVIGSIVGALCFCNCCIAFLQSVHMGNNAKYESVPIGKTIAHSIDQV